MQSTDNMEILELLRTHTREELGKILEFTEDNFERTVTAFLHENLRGLRRAMGSVKFEKQLIKQMKRTGTLAMCRLDNNTVLEKDFTIIRAMTSPVNWYIVWDVFASRVWSISTTTSSRWIQSRKENLQT